MRKITSLAAAAFAAITITASGYAQDYVTYAPAVAYVESAASTAFAADDESDRLFLADSALPEETPAVQADTAQNNDESYTAQDILKMIGISAIIGVVIALVICLIMKSRMKTAVPKITANDYIRKNSFNITRSRDIFIYSDVTKKKRQKPENK